MKKNELKIYLAYFSINGERIAKPCATLEGAKEYLMSELIGYSDGLVDEHDEELVKNDFEKEISSWTECPTASYEYKEFYAWVEEDYLYN